MTPRLEGVLETALYVEDLDRSVRFYEEVLGFHPIAESSNRLVAMSVADRQVLLLCKQGASVALVPGPHDGRGQLHVAFAVPDAELSKWETHLADHGVVIEERRSWERGGTSLYFRDPDRHLVELATPGVWSIY